MAGILLLVPLSLIFIYHLWLVTGWKGNPVSEPSSAAWPKVSIVIPFRNEAERIKPLLKSLDCQDYPRSKMQIILVDDHSEDDGVSKIKNHLNGKGLNYELLNLETSWGKKNALLEGIKKSDHNIIITTDADCYMGSQWVKSMALKYTSGNVKMVAGAVHIDGGNSFLEAFQKWENIALMAVTRCSMNNRKPLMCNGANLSFDKSTFHEVGGYTVDMKVSSGDDMFLMQSFTKRSPDSVVFNNDVNGRVYTNAESTWRSFLQQRIRWAGKWKFYRNKFIKLSALLVLLWQLIQPTVIIYSMYQQTLFSFILLLVLLITLCLELYLYIKTKKWLHSKVNVFSFFFLKGLYLIYAVSIGVLGLISSKYEWKRREIQR